MDQDEVRSVVNALLNLWQNSVQREGALTRLLDKDYPDWMQCHTANPDESELARETAAIVAPMRDLAEAVLQGNLTEQILDKALGDFIKKPN